MLCYINISGVACWSGEWLDQLEVKLNSASVEVEVEVEAELGKRKCKNWLNVQTLLEYHDL